MPQQQEVTGRAATMTVLAMGLGYSITAADPTILSANLAAVRHGLGFSPSTASFLACLATLTLAAAVLGAGALGDLYGMKRLFVIGSYGSIGFGVLAAVAPNVAVLTIARAGIGIAFAFVLGLSLAIINAAFPPGRRAAAIAMYLGAGHALSVFQPAIGSWLAAHFGWRACFLVTPVLAAVTLALTLRYVPETLRWQRKLDIVEELLPLVRRVADASGAAVVLVEQHVSLALEISDRALVLVHGKVSLDRPAQELRADVSLIEASYFGDEPVAAPPVKAKARSAKR